MPLTLADLRQAHTGFCAAAAALVIALLGTGCTGRYVTRTEYLAPDFSRAALRGRTVAVVPAADEPAPRDHGELAGVARGIHDAGARVRLIEAPAVVSGSPVPSAPGARHPPGAPSPIGAQPRPAAQLAALSIAPESLPVPDRVSLLADFTGDPDAEAIRRDAARWGRDVDAQYLLFVRVTDADVYHSFTPPHDGGAATRTSGRRVGLRLALVRLRDSAAVWVASGTGETWETSTASAAVRGVPAAQTVDDDLDRGNLPLYPPPPQARDLASRLTRRLLARVPLPVEIEPN